MPPRAARGASLTISVSAAASGARCSCRRNRRRHQRQHRALRPRAPRTRRPRSGGPGSPRSNSIHTPDPIPGTMNTPDWMPAAGTQASPRCPAPACPRRAPSPARGRSAAGRCPTTDPAVCRELRSPTVGPPLLRESIRRSCRKHRCVGDEAVAREREALLVLAALEVVVTLLT